MPEFGNLTALMQFNSYHQYTADEHTLIAIETLDALSRGELKGFRDCPQLPDSDRKDLLSLSLLLHDVGKFMGSGHVPRGALMVQPIASRMGLDEEEEDLVHLWQNMRRCLTPRALVIFMIQASSLKWLRPWVASEG